MNSTERRIAAWLTPQMRDMTASQTIEYLLDRGWIDLHRAEQGFLRHAVEEECARGLGRCEAFEKIAILCNCSYGKVRNSFYSNTSISEK